MVNIENNIAIHKTATTEQGVVLKKTPAPRRELKMNRLYKKFRTLS